MNEQQDPEHRTTDQEDRPGPPERATAAVEDTSPGGPGSRETATPGRRRPGPGRRALLGTATAGLVVAAGGLLWRAVDQNVFQPGTGPAYEPWETWREDTLDGPDELVRAAVLASNAHNSQPWLFRYDERTVDVFADAGRNLGAIDPFLRELHTSIGCALENLVLAAEQRGRRPRVRLLPGGAESTWMARVELDADGGTDPTPASEELHRAIPARRTNRSAYEADRGVPTDDVTTLAGEDPDVGVVWLTGRRERGQLAAATVAATEALVGDEEQAADSYEWVNFDRRDLERERSGITADASVLDPLTNVLAKMLPDTQASNDAGFVRMTRDVHTAGPPVFGLVTVDDVRDPARRLEGGRLWQRLHLAATALGLGAQPLSQTTERADREAQLGLEPVASRVLGDLAGGREVLMVFRIGWPTRSPGIAPRRPVEAVTFPTIDGRP